MNGNFEIGHGASLLLNAPSSYSLTTLITVSPLQFAGMKPVELPTKLFLEAPTRESRVLT